MRVELIYPGFKYTDPDKGVAVAVARVTKTMYIIHPRDVKILSGKMQFGSSTQRRYRKKDGREIGSDWRNSGWKVTRELSETVEHSEATCPTNT